MVKGITVSNGYAIMYKHKDHHGNGCHGSLYCTCLGFSRNWKMESSLTPWFPPLLGLMKTRRGDPRWLVVLMAKCGEAFSSKPFFFPLRMVVRRRRMDPPSVVVSYVDEDNRMSRNNNKYKSCTHLCTCTYQALSSVHSLYS